MQRRLLPLLLCLIAPLHAETRDWRNTDASRSVRGDFVKRDATSVSIVREDGKGVEIPLDRLHADDLRWLDDTHPHTPVATPEAATDENALFGILNFGDTRERTLEKLRNSEIVEPAVPEAMLARVGLNGSFRTRAKIGGKNALLFFEWTDDGKLRDVQLRSDPAPAASYHDDLGTCWRELAELLSVLHGKALVSSDALPTTAPAEGLIVPTHTWKLDQGGTAQLGAAREDGQVRIVVHFTTQSLIQEVPSGGEIGSRAE